MNRIREQPIKPIPQLKPVIVNRFTIGKRPLPAITFMKVQRCINVWRKRAKNSRHRFNVLKEWIETEKNYNRDLQLIIDKIEQPLKQTGKLTELQMQTVLPNVDILSKLSKSMQADLEKLKGNWKPSLARLAPVLLALEPYFKVYTDYCKKYYKGMEILNGIRQTEEFQKIEKSLPMDVASYLIKPIQRPPKYLLFLRQYHKHMHPSHPDYQQLTVALDRYHQLNEVNNESIEKEGRNQKFFQLEKLYGHLMESNREYLRISSASTLQFDVKLYIFNDLILVNRVIDESKEESHKVMEIDEYSYVQLVPDGKYFQNKMLLCCRFQAIHLLYVNKATLHKQYRFFRDFFNSYRSSLSERKSVPKLKNELKVAVTLNQNAYQQQPMLPHFKIVVRGAEKRAINCLRNQTVYIVCFSTMQPWKLFHNISLHYSQIEDLYGHVQKRFPQLLLPELTPAVLEVGLYDRTKNKSKIIEYRIMAVQEVLNRIFRCDRIMVNPASIMNKLAVSNTLWNFAVDFSQYEQLPECKCLLCQRGNVTSLTHYLRQRTIYVKKRKQLQRQDYCIVKYARDQQKLLQIPRQQLNSLQGILLYLEAYEGRLDFMKVYRPPGDDIKIKVYLPSVSNTEYIELETCKEVLACQIINLVAGELDIINMQDYALFLDYSGEPRMLEPHEAIYDSLVQLEVEVQDIGKDSVTNAVMAGIGFINKLMARQKSRLYMRKYFFLPPEIEYFSNRTYHEKYRLVVEQGLCDVSRNIIRCNEQELAELAALYLMLKEMDRVSFIKINRFPKDTTLKILPNSFQGLVNKTEWLQLVLKYIEDYKNKGTQQIIRIYDWILEIFKRCLGWGYHFFPLTSDNPQAIGHHEVLLGVNHKDVVVMSKKKDELIIQIPLDVLDYKISVFSIFIEWAGQTVRFNGRMLYNIDQLIRKYAMFKKLFGHLYATVSQSEIKAASLRTTTADFQ